jgi:DNA-binding IclR family transcriptional regulator
MSEVTDIILATLATEPEGLTSAEVATRTGMTSYNTSTKLSKLAAYGHIEKHPNGSNRQSFRWRAKPAARTI